MMLKIGKNTGSGATWHIIEDSDTICGSQEELELDQVQKFKGLDQKPTHGTWCGVCKRIYKGDSFKAKRTRGPIHP